MWTLLGTLQKDKCCPKWIEAVLPGGSSTPSRPVPQGPLDADLLTIFAAPHGGAVDSLILFIVERVAIPIHWVVEKREVAVEEEHRVRRGCAGNTPRASEPKSGGAVPAGPPLFCGQWMMDVTRFPHLSSDK